MTSNAANQRKKRQTQIRADLIEIIKAKNYSNIQQIERWLSNSAFCDLLGGGRDIDIALEMSKIRFTTQELISFCH
jgi:hypothetical protein